MGQGGPISRLALLLYSGRVSAAHHVWAVPWPLGRVGYAGMPPQPVLLPLSHVCTAWEKQVLCLPSFLLLEGALGSVVDAW